MASRLLAIVATLLILACPAPQTAAGTPARATPLVLERTISLPGVAGRIDHMAFDLGRGRLLVAELGNDSLEAIDLATARPLYRVVGLAEPQGVAYAPAADAIAVANGADGQVRFFRGTDFAPIGAVALGNDADDAVIDSADGRVVVGFGGGGLAVVDPVRRAVVATVKLPAHPEAFRISPDGRRAFVNLPDAEQVAVVDLRAARQIATWRFPAWRANFPMALDAAGHVLAIVFRRPPTLVLLAAADGAIMAHQATCGDADDVFFDASRHRVYVSCGAGAVDVFGDDGNSLTRIARIATSAGARTSLFVPEIDRLFVAARAPPLGGDAAILILRPQP